MQFTDAKGDKQLKKMHADHSPIDDDYDDTDPLYLANMDMDLTGRKHMTPGTPEHDAYLKELDEANKGPDYTGWFLTGTVDSVHGEIYNISKGLIALADCCLSPGPGVEKPTRVAKVYLRTKRLPKPGRRVVCNGNIQHADEYGCHMTEATWGYCKIIRGRARADISLENAIMQPKPNLIGGDYLREMIRQDHPNFAGNTVETWYGDSGRIFESLLLATPLEDIIAAVNNAGFKCAERYAAADYLKQLAQRRRSLRFDHDDKPVYDETEDDDPRFANPYVAPEPPTEEQIRQNAAFLDQCHASRDRAESRKGDLRDRQGLDHPE